ncbi:MAG: T9SS type A sorting domain-containing protein [Cytophagaceae bacterium]
MKINTLLICILLISTRQLNAQNLIIKNSDGTAVSTLAPSIKKISFTGLGEMLVQKQDNTVSNYPLSSISYFRVQDTPMGLFPSSPLVNPVSIGLGLFPNPVTNQINITMDKDQPPIEKIQIQSLTGQTIQTLTEFTQSNEVSLNCENLYPGMYVCTIYTKEFSSVVKFIKQ